MKYLNQIITVLLAVFIAKNSFGIHTEEKPLWKNGQQIDEQVFEDDFNIEAEFNEIGKKTYWQTLSNNKNRILIGAVLVAIVVAGVYYSVPYINSNGMSTNPEIPSPETIPISTPEPAQENQILASCKDQIEFISDPSNANTSTYTEINETNLEVGYAAAFDSLRDAIKSFGKDHQGELEEFRQLDRQHQDQVQEITKLKTSRDQAKRHAEKFQGNPNLEKNLAEAQRNLETAEREAGKIEPTLRETRSNILRYQSLETEARTKLQEIGDAGLARDYQMNIRIPEPVFNIN